MPQFDPKFASFLLTFVCVASGWVVWWVDKFKSGKQQAIQEAKAAAEKAVNEKRDFNHLINNQREISKNIAHGFEDIENQMRAQNEKLQEIKAYLIRNQKTDK
ncbi:hypothetical protein [Nostoc sp.]|uniref:hypothetical protein n=1 Tax=Nostoc sp. TaxID=1180 RepID=UPI002FFCA2FE